MQNPDIILDILYNRSYNNVIDKNKNNIYHYLYNPEWYIMAYKELSNRKNIDQNLIARINSFIEDIRAERYKWSYNTAITNFNKAIIDVQNDMLVIQTLKYILSAIYEPIFNEYCHSYRDNYNCATALARIYQKGQASEFFIVGKLPELYNHIDSKIFIEILNDYIHDGRICEMLRKFLKAKYYARDFNFNTFSDAPQCSGISGLLLNIYLSKLDNFILTTYNEKYNKEDKRPINPDYLKVSNRIGLYEKYLAKGYKEDKHDELIKELKLLRKKRNTLPHRISICKTDYRRFTYTRYGAEFIITFTGTYREAQEICNDINNHISMYYNINKIDSVKIFRAKETNEKKMARFLNYTINIEIDNSKKYNGRRSLVQNIVFYIPHDIETKTISKYSKNNKPIHISNRITLDVDDIIRIYQRELSNICQYYIFARNKKSLSIIKYTMLVSLVKTLANKFRTSVTSIYKKYHNTIKVNDKPYKVIQSDGAHFGGIPLLNTTPSKYISIIDKRL